MFFNADQTKGAISSVVPEKSAHSQGPGQQDKLSPDQFPGKGTPAPEAAEGAEAAGAGAEAAAGGASLAELAPLLAL